MTMYAWSPILAGKPGNKDTGPGEITRFKLGDTVTAESLGVSEDEFNGMVASGSVRSYEPPKMPATFQGSPIDFLKEQAAKASDDAVNTVMASPEVLAAITASTTAATGSALSPENVDPEVQEEWDRQARENQAGGGEVAPTANETTTQFRTTENGLFASDDGGNTWRLATDEEKAANQ